jgi:putative ATP-dependent endonuclease of OLD family
VGTYEHLVKKMNAEGNPRRIGFTTKKRAIENYLHHKAIEEAFRIITKPVPVEPIEDTEDVPYKAAKALAMANGDDWDAMSEEAKKEKKGKRKQLLNGLAVDKMTIQLLAERNAIEEMQNWFRKIGVWL